MVSRAAEMSVCLMEVTKVEYLEQRKEHSMEYWKGNDLVEMLD
jgi:phage pi2 protein 07